MASQSIFVLLAVLVCTHFCHRSKHTSDENQLSHPPNTDAIEAKNDDSKGDNEECRDEELDICSALENLPLDKM